MVRMLFLRDIDTDVEIRCRDCGHGGVLGRAMLVRRFGPGYPVLSIAPHYRCSRCDSRDTECRPAQPPEPVETMPAAEAPDEGMAAFDATIAALRGLVDAAHGSRSEPVPAPPMAEAADEDPDDTLVRPPSREPVWEPARDAVDEPPPPLADEEPEPEPPAFPPEFAALFERAYADDPEEEAPPRGEPDRPVFAMAWDDNEDRDEEPEAPSHAPEETPAGEPEGWEEEPSEDEILSFAIRDRDEDIAPRNRRAPAAAEDDSDATLSMQKTLAALRGMIESAAAEPGDVAPPPKAAPLQPPPKPAPATAASLDDTLAKLRGLLDLDGPGGNAPGRDAGGTPGGRRR